MKRTLRLLAGLLCLLLTLPAVAQRNPNVPPKWDEPPINGVSRAMLRLFYFYQPRIYPHNDLPPNHWLNALNHAQQLPVEFPQTVGLGIQALGEWEFMGPDTTNFGWLGRVNAIVPDRTNANTLYIGVAKGGVWKSTNGGTNWSNLTDNITQYVGCLTQDPVNANTLYMGTGEEYYSLNTFGGVGIYKSTDGGATWTLHGNSTFAGSRINAIVIDPTNTNKWIVGADNGIWVTTNAGTTFTRTLNGAGSALRMHPTNANIVYAALGSPFGNAANGVYKSTNGGSTWTKLAGGLPTANVGRIELDIHKASPDTLYVAVGSSASNLPLLYLGKTTNGGANWTSLTLPTMSGGANRDSWYNFMMRADPVDPNIAYFGQVEVFRTTNSGGAWTNITPDHPDMHALEFDPTNAQKIYLGQDAGLYVSTNRGTAWSKLNAARGTMEYYAFDVHPTDASKLAAGAQDNSTHVRTGTNSFNVVIGGDGFWTAYKKTDPNIMLGEYQYGNIFRSTDGGVNWAGVAGVNGYWSTPIINDPTNPSRFYSGNARFVRSSSDGAANTWQYASAGNLGRGGSAQPIVRIAVAPSNGNVVYTGSLDGGLWRTANATAASPTWTERSTGLPNASIGGIAVDPANADIVYVGMQGYGINHVLKSTNGGATWTNYSGDLPDAAVTGVVVNPLDTTQLLVCTDVGVFLTSNGTSWSRYGTGLPTVPNTHLVANATTGWLTVSTYGRGMWRINLPSNNPVPILNSINPTAARVGGAAFNLTLTGSGFTAASKARWNGVDRTTTFNSSTQLTAAIPASDLAASGTANVTVFNPAPGGGTSAARPFVINAAPFAGLSGATLNMDGVNDAVTVAHNAALNPYPFTASFWLKTSENNGARTGLVAKYPGGSLNGWQVFLQDGKVNLYYFRNNTNYVWDGDTNTFSTPSVADGNWHHIAATVDASGGKLYVDGVLRASRGWVGTPGAPTSTQALALGQYGPEYITGQMDEVSIWNVALNQTQIQQGMAAQLLGSEANLVAYYRLNEGTGSTTSDITGHGHTGTLNGTPTWVASSAPVNTVHVQNDTPRAVTLGAFDAEVDPLTWSVVTNPAFGALSGTAPNLTYTPVTSYTGSDQFTYRVSDGLGNSNTATVLINYGLPSVTFNGTTTGTLLHQRPNVGQPPATLSASATATAYTVFKVTVPTTGSYNFDVDPTTANYDPFTALYTSDFNPAAALTNAIVSNDDKTTVDRSGFNNIMMTAGTDYLFVVSGYDNGDVGDFTARISGAGVATVVPLRFITGTVTLETLIAAGYPQPITFQIRPQGGTAFTRTRNVSSTGTFELINLLPVTHEIAMKGTRWLQQAQPFNLTSGSASGSTFTLLAGDANNNNSVDITDLLVLIGAYNQVSPAAGYVLSADFNGDGLNDITDLLALIANYNKVGSP